MLTFLRPTNRSFGTRNVRDMQRSKLYKAEQAWRAAIGDKQFPTKLAAWAFIERVERSKWFRRTYGVRKFNVHDGRGRTSAAAWGSRNITLPRWSRTPAVILHEIAHCVTNTEHGQVGVAGHGWQYAHEYLRLVRHFMGVEAYRKLRGHFVVGRVRYKKPRTGRPMTEAQMVAFAKMRAALTERRAAAKTQP